MPVLFLKQKSQKWYNISRNKLMLMDLINATDLVRARNREVHSQVPCIKRTIGTARFTRRFLSWVSGDNHG